MSDDHLKLIRPSNFARSVLCPGWSRLAAAVPHPPSSDAAEEGTLLHKRLPPETLLDDLTDEQRHHVEKARAFIAEKTAGAKHIDYEWPFQEPLPGMVNGGTADVVDWDNKLIIDLKFGRLPLSPAFASFQSMIYAELARAQTGEKKFAVWFYQPRADAEDGTWHAVATKKDKVQERVADVMAKVKAPNAPRVPGEEQCRYCPALAWCPEAADHTAEFAIMAREPLQGLSPIQLGHLGGLAKRAEKQAAAVMAAIREILQAGGAVPGFALEARKGSRYIHDPQEAYELLKDTLPLPQFLGLLEVPIGALEEAWLDAALARAWEDGKEVGEKPTKKELRAELYRRLERAIGRKPDYFAMVHKEGS